MTATFEGPPPIEAPSEAPDAPAMGVTDFDPTVTNPQAETPAITGVSAETTAPATPEAGETTPDQTRSLVLGGLRNAVLRKRVQRAVRLSGKNDDSGEVMSEMSASVMRGNSSLPTTPRHYQKGHERRGHVKQTLRKEARARARLRIEARADVYGTTDDNGNMFPQRDAQGNTIPVAFDGSVTEGQRAMNYGLVLKGGDSMPLERTYGYNTTRKEMVPTDLGTSSQLTRLKNGRYSRGRVRSELKAARQQHEDATEIAVLDNRIAATIDSEDFRGRRVSRRARRHAKRAVRLNNKLQSRVGGN